ncbi:MAG: hypothetical protein Alis3KO_28720 [Aliiglaciecola sp.]
MTVFNLFKSKNGDPSKWGLADVLSLLVLVLLSLVLILQVLSRYLLNSPLGWTEEIARYLLIVLTFLGAAICFRKGTHISFLYVLNLLPHKAKNTANTILSVVGMLIVSFLIYSAAKIIPQLEHFVLSSIDISLSFLYWVILIALALCAVGSVQHVLSVVRSRRL